MDELTSGLDADALMDLDEAEGSDLDDEDEEFIDEPLPSPLQLPASGPGSTTTSIASSPPNNEDFLPPFHFSGKPLSSLKRGRGRPRREGGKPLPRRQGVGSRIRRIKPPGYGRGGGPRRFKSVDHRDFDLTLSLSNDELTLLDPETGALIFSDKPSPILDEVPYAPESWPGKVCAFCNLGDRSQLGQAEILRLNCPEGFTPQRVSNDSASTSISLPERESGDKSPRGPVTCRRQKSFNKCRNPSLTSEYIDELTIIGHTEEPDVTILFESVGHFYVHRNCALWSNGVTRTENYGLENVGPIVLQSTSKKCSFCNHFGASVTCKMDGCSKIYHFPCATASGAFQELSTLTLFCTNHMNQASLCESSVCYTCKTLGDIANLMYCSSCGEHYHGTCVGLSQMPGVRAGWQCRKCRLCQICRMVGDETKLMNCEQCDKVYHASCQRPIVATIPKYGWKCRCCRVCGDCGSRTPGAGQSSRWHAHYTVCDSCYQQRNKGFCCPICHRAYRAHAHREMVQCSVCTKFVHGTCDPEADLTIYHQRKESHTDYEYTCSLCKNANQPGRHILMKRNSIEDGGDSLSASQESLYDESLEFETNYSDSTMRSMGLGKGKPFSACKIAKKRLGYVNNMPGRSKGWGKGLPGKVGFMKRQRLTEFGRKRGPKAKMRGMFGVPGVGLQRPVSDGKGDEEPGVENRLVLCSAKDKFVLTQDICVMCGALGTDQEGCLISCVQCGQCYHPYCVNVKVTKVVLQKGWRCLDCTVCEGCGHRNDESRLILCDDCDISYHIYCMDPPMDYVPHGNWKCKWCAMCQSCGSTDPGFNCTWMNSFSECGPCASHNNCASCMEAYNEGDLIIQCVQCERWLHGICDLVKTEEDAERCAEEGYNCLLCRPRDVPPPHLIPSVTAPKPPTPTKSPEVKSSSNFVLDGIYLSESGHNLIKSLITEHHATRKKRKKLPTVQDKEAGIMATIESVVSGGNMENTLDDRIELVDVKEEPQEIYKEGMMWAKEDGPPPEGFTVFTMENGISVLRRKRQRNLQKMGIGGFLVRVRGIRGGQENDDMDVLPGQTSAGFDSIVPLPIDGDKPRRKPVRRKPKSKLAETFPPYLQEAFFGKELLDSSKELASSSSDEEKNNIDIDKSIHLSQDEIKAVAAVTIKKEKHSPLMEFKQHLGRNLHKLAPLVAKEEEEDDNTEELKDVLNLPGDLLDTDLVNTIMNEDDEELTKDARSLEALASDSNLPDETDIGDTLGNPNNSKDTKDELSDILGSHFNLDAIPNINSKDVEDIFKGVLTDESQESQESNAYSLQSSNVFAQTTPQASLPQHPITTPPVRPTTLPAVNLNSPMSFPPPSPYQSEYSNSPQFSPAFSETANSWVTSVNDPGELDTTATTSVSTYNQRSSEKMKADEGLGSGATISAVLYANMNHPEWKADYPNWNDRYKQMIKKWRTLSSDQKAPYLQQARDNRSALRMKKQQQSQISKESSSTTTTTKVAGTPPAPLSLPSQIPAIATVSEDQEKVTLQQKSAREAEQERQWKQLQAVRHQQAQQQQHVIHEQRVQDLQVSTTPQELSPVTSPPSTPRQFHSLGIKSSSYTNQQSTIRPTTPAQTTLDFSPSAPDSNDPYSQQPATPKPQTSLFQTRLPTDPYAQQPATPRTQFSLPRSNVQSFPVRQDTPENNNHLRDLLQRQQFKKLDEQLLAGKGQQRLWPPSENQEGEIPVSSSSTSSDATFRQPLPPPGIARPRLPVPISNVPRQMGALINLRMQPERLQGIDSRMRLLIQQQQQTKQRLIHPGTPNPQQQQQQTFQAGASVRFPGNSVRPSTVDQYEQLLQRQQSIQSRAEDQQAVSHTPLIHGPMPPRQTMPQLTASVSNTPSNIANDQEIPDNVTAELEKLERETGTMVELHGVSDILGGLGDDDDELLAEMGADFNILEYADPELEALAGEKTNILDLELEEEPMKKEKLIVPRTSLPQATVTQTIIKRETVAPITSTPSSLSQTIVNNQPPPLAVSQPQNSVTPSQPSAPTLQQIHLQMIQQVQQAAAQNRPMLPGSKLQTVDGVTGIVTPNNNVQLHVPPNYQRILMSQLQHHKLQIRVGPQTIPRVMNVNPTTQQMHPGAVNLASPRMSTAPPPPPPYPGPPPPYPGSSTSAQMGLRMGPEPPLPGHVHHLPIPSVPGHPQQRRPLLLEEQPLLLEDLLEQEKREQEKQNQTHITNNQDTIPSVVNSESALLSDHDFERLKADVFNTSTMCISSSGQGSSTTVQNQWQQNQPCPVPVQPPPEAPPRVQLFSANLLPAPPLPPENIISEQDKQAQMIYEQWLNHQNNVLTQQLRYYETEVQKLRKIRKSLNSKQRQLRKSGNQLAEGDANELQRISSEQAVLQKHLETSRKQTRQHSMLMQEYRNKQAKQQPGQVSSPHIISQGQSPLGPPGSSPIHHAGAAQSPMMSPSASPLTQHNSPLHSPGQIVTHSPGPNLLQSPSSSMAGSSMSPLQPSPRIGTPHSQNDSPVHSPSQICLPPPAPRMTSPQHRRIVTSPVAYSATGSGPGTPQLRFIRNPTDHSASLQQRVRLASPSGYPPKSGTPSPLNSPPQQQINITQQILQKQLHQHALMQQQHQQTLDINQQNENSHAQFQRVTQLIKQRNIVRQAQQQQQQQQQQGLTQLSQQLGSLAQQQLGMSQQQLGGIAQQLGGITQQLGSIVQHGIAQPQPLTPQQHQLMIQQQQQLAKQQQQNFAQMQAQARLNQQQNNPPKSPMPPKSPLVQQILSPHSMPPSPMPPRSPMLGYGNQPQTPNSPVARSPVFHQSISQPPNSPMMHQSPSSMPRSPMLNQIQSPMSGRRPPSSPAIPDRPTSVENPRTPYTPESMLSGGGGNPNNPANPIPAPPCSGKFGYFKLGLRGGSPMWNVGKGTKRVPTPPTTSKEFDKTLMEQAMSQIPKIKKESHLSKVSILKKKSSPKIQSSVVGRINSLVSTDYNEFDDSSSTPPVTPPPMASSSRIQIQKCKKLGDSQETKDGQVIVATSNEKHIRCDDIMDYDDDNHTVLSTVSLSSTAQNDCDDIAVIETLSQSDLTVVMSSPLEAGQISDEYLLFHGNITEEQYSDKEEVEGEYVSENMHIVIRSPTTSDDELIMQSKTKPYGMHDLTSEHVLSMTDTPDSPEQEEMNVDPSPESEETDINEVQGYGESEIVYLNPPIKISEEQISTKEDFEELIDEGSRKEKILKPAMINVSDLNDFHKYATNVYSVSQKTAIQVIQKPTTVTSPTPRGQHKQQTTHKVMFSTPVIHNIAVSQADANKIPTTGNQPRTSVLTIPKLVSSGSPVITIVSGTSQMNTILPSGFTVPVISASTVRQLTNVKVIDKPSSSLSLTTHDSCLPNKIFEDDSVSPDSSNCEDEKKDSSDEKSKSDSPSAESSKHPIFPTNENDYRSNKASRSNIESNKISRIKDELIKDLQSKDKFDVNSVLPIMNDASIKEIVGVAKEYQGQRKENMKITSIITSESQRIPSPIISKASSPIIIHTTPELKMTAQVFQETQSRIQITARTESDSFEMNSSEDTKSVVISIPSPTPSQEQMLDNITLQALENRRRDGKGIPSGFESFEDVFDMIENITGETPTVLEDNIKDKIKLEDADNSPKIPTEQIREREKVSLNMKREMHSHLPASVNFSKPSTMPQLSPLSQPTDLTTNVANATQQLRTLLSLHTTSSCSGINVESVVKSINNKITSTSVVVPASPIVTSRIIQHVGQPITTANLGTVIVPNLKTKAAASHLNNSIKATYSLPSSVVVTSNTVSNIHHIQTPVTIGFLPSRTVGGIQLMPDHPKLPPVTSVIATIQNSPIITQHTTNMAVHKTSVISTSTSNNQEVVNRKPSLTLTAMLQSHPAATPTTRSSVDTITAASILGTTIGLSRSGFSTSLVQAQPNVVISPTAVSTSSLQSNMSNKLSLITSSSQATNRTGSATNLLHTQLTKVMKNKPITEVKNEMPKVEEIKHEPKEDIEDIVKQELSPCKSNIFQAQLLSRMEDSQNVLLKKLLQNTGCASTQSLISSSQSSITTAAPITTNVTSNIESQQSKAPPTLSSLLPTVIKTEPNSQSPQPKMHLPPQRLPLMSRETSFVSSPTVQIPQTTTTVVPSQQLHIDVKKCMPPSRTPSRDDLLSPQTPRSSCSQDSSLHTPPLIVKKEINHAIRQSPILTPQEVKKEFMDETSQHSEVSDHSRPDIQLKEEIDSLDAGNEKMMVDQKEELKKQKRRMYQQKRRQNQILNKETTVQPKKRPRKSSKVDEDYDTYIDSVLAQLRALPSMNVSEPILNRNFGVVPIFGSGDLNKLGNKEYDSRLGDLMGCYGDALVPDFLDFYDTKPFGDADPLPEKPPASTQRGFYDKEFPLIKFDNEEMKRFDLFSREDSPDSIISSSSPECPILESRREFMGLKLIDEDEDEEDEEDMLKARLSPLVPIITPTPIRLKPASANPSKKDIIDDKENNGRDVCMKPKFGSTQSSPLKDSGNVTVTLTLTSSAAEDIMGVLRDLANILHIPAPTSYQIVERTSTPPSQKLGLYRTKGKDGKEGAPIDIQSILNGAAKFCKHCDVVILNNMIKKRVSELPFLYKDSELVGDGDDLYFCSSTCYMQFALMHRSPLMSEDKAAAIIDHLCQKDKRDLKRRPDNMEPKHTFMENMDIMNDIKSEMNIFDDKSLSMFNKPYETLKAKSYLDESSYPTKSWKNIKYKLWSYSCLQPPTRFKKPTDKETMELLYKLGVTVTSPKGAEDTRKCMFCQGIGDAVADGPGRLLNFDVDKWVHLNCGLWSEGVYETVNGALMNLENALRQSLITSCIHCHNLGATVRCFKTRCSSVYHLNCAVKDNCVFFKNKTTYCTFHIPKNEKDSELTTLSVSRRVYINRDENRQVAAVMHHSDTNNLLRVGSLIFLNVGQLLPHQLQNFHTPNYIYPIGYKIIRFYWSMRRLNKRCRYICSIQEVLGRPEFRVLVQESPEEDMEFKDSTPKGIWIRIVEQLATLRRESQCVQVFPKFVNGEDLFGLTEPAVVRVLESLPGIETLTDYKFKYGRNPLLELPLAINPSGAARTEPKLKNLLHWKRPHTQRSAGGSSLRPLFGPAPAGPTISTFSEVACPYSKQFVHSKSSQYKKMKQEWRNNVYLARSKIQGLGLYSARDLEKHTMVIEYIGELIRTELAETREKKYEARNRGIYMFRLDEDRVVDATLSGGLARYINHSCNPNCVAEIVEVDRDLRIIIFSKRRIQRGEELSYDYKFDIEDDQHKISCMCGAPNCRKWMN